MLGPLLALGAIVVVALAGRAASGPVETTRLVDRAVAAALSPVAVANVTPVPTPSRRSDWPAAIANRDPSAKLARQPREEGTDGLMGGLPFGIPGDTPTIHPERVNRFTIDDAVRTSARADMAAPGLSAGPYVR